eukprot:g16673.t1
MKSKRCEACDHGRGTLKAIGIEVEHMVGFECRCGHRHGGAQWPPFPQSVECDDAPVAAVLPEACAESSCVICLGHLDDEARGALKGAPAARPLAQLVDARGQVVCKHFFHLPCAKQLQSRFCPLCRTAFREVAALSEACIMDTPVIQRSRASYSSEPLCKEALVSMARLASWPLGVVIQMMSFLLRRERVGVAFAVPAWKEAAQAPVFWEAQEVQCFHEKTGPDEDVIGIGVLAQGRGRLATLTAHFDAISRTAWQGGLRKAAWKEPQGAAWKDLRNRRVQAVDAIVAFPEMMHQLLKQVLYGDRHASLKLLKGYFVMHRLFLHCCDQWPEIRVAADMALKQFISSPEGRTKQATPWLAYILQLLTVSNVGWEEVKEAFLQEALAREVQFILPRYPSYCPSRPGESGEDQLLTPPPRSIVASMLGSDRAGGGDAEQLTPEAFRGARRGWTCIAGAVRRGSSAFSVHIRSMPADSVIRIGWIRAEGGFEDGWGFHASECYGTACGWKAHEGRWQRYGTFFQEGDTITAMVQNGSMSFLKNGRNLGVAFHVPVTETLRPAVALRRRAEVFFLTLVRPAESPPYWSRVKAEYDKRYGFPAPEMQNREILFDEVTYNFAMYGILLHPRQEDELARQAFLDMEEDGRFHPALLRLHRGFLESYFELKEVDATPNPMNLLKVTRTFWQISVNFKRKRVKETRFRLAARGAQHRFEPESCDAVTSMSWGNKGWNRGVQAPVGSNPFAPAPAGGGGGPCAGPGGGPGGEDATGPMLSGKGPELQKVYYMPHNMGHNDGVNCMVMADNKIFSGGRDENLFVWRAEKSPSGEMQLVQDWAPGLDRRIAPAKSRRAPSLELEDDDELSDGEFQNRVKRPPWRPRQLMNVYKGSGVPNRRKHRWKH